MLVPTATGTGGQRLHTAPLHFRLCRTPGRCQDVLVLILVTDLSPARVAHVSRCAARGGPGGHQTAARPLMVSLP